MTIRRFSLLLFTVCASLLFTIEGTITSSAPVDRRTPTAPTNLTVTGVTETTVGLSWGRSTANGRIAIASYKIRLTNLDNSQYNTLVTVSGSQTTHTATFLAPGSTYSIAVYAVDSTGTRSPDSNVVTIDTLADETPPTTPALSAVVVSPSQVSLTWSKSTDNLPLNCCTYTIVSNDAPVTQYINWMGESATSISATVRRLTPGTQYTFKVTARDFYQNTATSNTVTVTTETSTDTVAPSAPTDLYLVQDHSCGEIDLGWTQAMDDVDSQPFIEYEIYVNGVISPLPVSAGVSVDFVYATAHGDNVFTVRAVDRSGNVSEPSKPLTLFLWPC